MRKKRVTIRYWQNSKMDENVAIGFGSYIHNKRDLGVVIILNFTVWKARMRQRRILNIPSWYKIKGMLSLTNVTYRKERGCRNNGQQNRCIEVKNINEFI